MAELYSIRAIGAKTLMKLPLLLKRGWNQLKSAEKTAMLPLALCGFKIKRCFKY